MQQRPRLSWETGCCLLYYSNYCESTILQQLLSPFLSACPRWERTVGVGFTCRDPPSPRRHGGEESEKVLSCLDCTSSSRCRSTFISRTNILGQKTLRDAPAPARRCHRSADGSRPGMNFMPLAIFNNYLTRETSDQ